MTHRVLDAAMLWFLTVNPMAEVVLSVLTSASLSRGMLPHPASVLAQATSRIVARTISCLVTAFVAPDAFPYPWADIAASNGKSETHGASSPPPAVAQQQQQRHSTGTDQVRFLCTLLSLTGDGLTAHYFRRLPTTRLAELVSTRWARYVARPLRRALRIAAMTAAAALPSIDLFAADDDDVFVGYSGGSAAAQHQSAAKSPSERADDMELADAAEKDAHDAFGDFARAAFDAGLRRHGPLRTALMRNAVAVTAHLLHEQAAWAGVLLLSRSRLARRALVGRLVHRSAVLPWAQAWRMHAVSSCVALVDVACALAVRCAGAVAGYHAVALATRGGTNGAATAWVSLADGAVYGEQLCYLLSARLRHRATYTAGHAAGTFLYSRCPIAEDDESNMLPADIVEMMEAEQQAAAAAEAGADDGDTTASPPVDASAGAPSDHHQQQQQQQPRRGRHIRDDEFDEWQRSAVYTAEDYYAALEVPSSATRAEIRRAYLASAKQCHPDRLAGASAAERDAGTARFKVLQRAYEVLGDDARRSEYDAAQLAGLVTGPAGMGMGGGAGGPGGLHPAVFAARFASVIHKIPSPALQKVAAASTGAAACGLLLTVGHWQIATAFAEFLKPGV